MAFLTDEQRRTYGTFTQVPDDGQLAGYFLLDRDAQRLGRHWQPAGPADVYATTNGRRAGRPGTHLILLAPTSRRTAS
ncbi:hypothetical protein AB0F13_25070 [Streptomyces sp. NPDC026206]|uniref:hypothetical protein n=1 Tax=Streptomyces sp. NPDC026206 TaxID=3157089 RepID=UPI0033EB1F1A